MSISTDDNDSKKNSHFLRSLCSAFGPPPDIGLYIVCGGLNVGLGHRAYGCSA